MTLRIKRLNELFKRVISETIIKEINDPRVQLTTITKVDIAKDLSNAKVYFSVHGNKNKIKKTGYGLNNAAGFIRSYLGKNIKLRKIPALKFIYDKSLDHELKIYDLLNKISTEEKDNSEKNESPE